MKIWLKETDGQWKTYEGELAELAPELKKRNITLSASASIGAYASIGDDAKVERSYDCVVMGPLGSRATMLTGYLKKDGSLWIGTGCFLGPIAQFVERVDQAHKGTEHAQAYGAAVEFIRARLERSTAVKA